MEQAARNLSHKPHAEQLILVRNRGYPGANGLHPLRCRFRLLLDRARLREFGRQLDLQCPHGLGWNADVLGLRAARRELEQGKAALQALLAEIYMLRGAGVDQQRAAVQIGLHPPMQVPHADRVGLQALQVAAREGWLFSKRGAQPLNVVVQQDDLDRVGRGALERQALQRADIVRAVEVGAHAPDADMLPANRHFLRSEFLGVAEEADRPQRVGLLLRYGPAAIAVAARAVVVARDGEDSNPGLAQTAQLARNETALVVARVGTVEQVARVQEERSTLRSMAASTTCSKACCKRLRRCSNRSGRNRA